MPCNVCNDKYHEWLQKGKGSKIPITQKHENCPDCEARPRFKTFRFIYDQQIASAFTGSKQNLTALVISGTQWERETISTHFGTVVSTALYGQYGPNTIKSDIRNLKEFQDNKFDYVNACNVLDYIYQIDEVLGSVYRVLKPGGHFLFHIAEFRLVDSFDPPATRGTKREPYYPDDVELPSVIFGKHDLVERMKKHHFDTRKFEVLDIFSGEVCTWFLGKK